MNKKEEHPSLLQELQSVFNNENMAECAVTDRKPSVVHGKHISMSIGNAAQRLLPETNTSLQASNLEISLFAADLPSEQMNFVCSTLEYIAEILNCRIVLENRQIDSAMYIIVHTNAERLCARTHAYVKGILSKKSVVSFMWFAELFELARNVAGNRLSTASISQHMKQMAEKHIVCGDTVYGVSDAALLAHRDTTARKLFKMVSIDDPKNVLTPIEHTIILNNGGKLNAKLPRKKTITVLSKNEFYNLILAGSKSVLFDSRFYLKKSDEYLGYS